MGNLLGTNSNFMCHSQKQFELNEAYKYSIVYGPLLNIYIAFHRCNLWTELYVTALDQLQWFSGQKTMYSSKQSFTKASANAKGLSLSQWQAKICQHSHNIHNVTIPDLRVCQWSELLKVCVACLYHRFSKNGITPKAEIFTFSGCSSIIFSVYHQLNVKSLLMPYTENMMQVIRLLSKSRLARKLHWL